jgi:hypothetical protein
MAVAPKLAALAMKKGFDSDWRIHMTRPNQTRDQEAGSPYRFLNLKLSNFQYWVRV